MPSTQPIAQLLPLTPAILHIAIALTAAPRHGYGIMQTVETMTGGRVVLGAGTLYRSLQRMERDQLIEETSLGLPDAPNERRRYYRLTPLGRRVAEAEVRRLHDLLTVAQEQGLRVHQPDRSSRTENQNE